MDIGDYELNIHPNAYSISANFQLQQPSWWVRTMKCSSLFLRQTDFGFPTKKSITEVT